MKVGFNGASTMKIDLLGDIQVASKAGYELIEIWGKKMEAYFSEHSVLDLAVLLEKANLKPLAINSVESITFISDWEKINTKITLKRYAEIADMIGCPYIVIVPGPRPVGITDKQIFKESFNALLRISEDYEDYKVKFAFEFLGYDWCSVNKLQQAFEIVRSVNRDNIGLVLDTFHFYIGNSIFDSIKFISSDEIFIFHVNDSENLPKVELRDEHQLYPGEGIIPLNEIIVNLKKIGFDANISLKMLRPEYWNHPAEDVAKCGIEAIKKLIDSGGYRL